MPNSIIPADGAAMPAESHKSRRSALTLLVAAPALAILPAAAVASPTSTARLADLIAVHYAAVDAAVDADEARHPVNVSFLGRELSTIGTTRMQLIEDIDFTFQREMGSLRTLLRVSPELGEAARGIVERGKADCLAQIAAADAAKSAADEAEKVCIKALEAVCAHRCASVEELTTKVRYLATWGMELVPDQSAALYKSLLPEGVEIAAV